jgi:excisionase family DNA binding protein
MGAPIVQGHLHAVTTPRSARAVPGTVAATVAPTPMRPTGTPPAMPSRAARDLENYGPPAQWVTIAAAAQRLGISTKSIRRRIADGTLPAYRVGPRLIRLNLLDVDRLMVRPIPAARAAPDAPAHPWRTPQGHD